MVTSSKIINELFNEIENNKKKHHITSSIKLPALITNSQDVDFFYQEESEPNFITQLILESEVIVIENENVDIKNKIVLIENADPGFDWIWSPYKRIDNKIWRCCISHGNKMCRIRFTCGIGCGDLIFENILSSNIIRLDCLNKKITVLQ